MKDWHYYNAKSWNGNSGNGMNKSWQ